MTLEANESYVRAGKHARVLRSVRLMTRPAAFKPHRGVFEGERPAFVGMTTEAARFGARGRPRRTRLRAPVRIVAIDTGHRPFRDPVLEGLLELASDARVTGRA